MMLKKLVYLIFVFIPLQAHPANFFASEHNGAVSLLLFGQIEEGDAARFASEVEKANKRGLHVDRLSLVSIGGDVGEALEIGRLVRKYGIFTKSPTPVEKYEVGQKIRRIRYRLCDGGLLISPPIVSNRDGLKYVEGARVMPECICASACSLIWFAGLLKYGEIGVHRSYFSQIPDDVDFENYSKSLDRSHSAIASYLSEMRVPYFVIDRVNNTTSDDIYFFRTKGTYDDNDPKSPPLLETDDALFGEYLMAKCPSSLSEEELQELMILHEAEMFGCITNLSTLECVPFQMTKQRKETLANYRLKMEKNSECVSQVKRRMQRSSQGLRVD
jgi:hypothetical protein